MIVMRRRGNDPDTKDPTMLTLTPAELAALDAELLTDAELAPLPYEDDEIPANDE